MNADNCRSRARPKSSKQKRPDTHNIDHASKQRNRNVQSPTKAHHTIRTPSPGDVSFDNLDGNINASHTSVGSISIDDNTAPNHNGMHDNTSYDEGVFQDSTENGYMPSPSPDKGSQDNDSLMSSRNESAATHEPAISNGFEQNGLSSSRLSMSSMDRISCISEVANNLSEMQQNLQSMFSEAKGILTHYQNQLNDQSLLEFKEDVPAFTQAFTSLSEACQVCENFTEGINEQLQDVRTATREICELITEKTNSQDLSDFMENDHKDSYSRDLERVEREAKHKEQQARLQEVQAIASKATAQAQTAHELAAQAESKATQAVVTANNARNEAEIARKKTEEAIRAAQKKEEYEEQERRKAEEIAKKKEEEERKRREEEEERRIAQEAKSKGTSLEEERRRAQKEKTRLEAERKNPNNWPRYIYSVEGGDWNPGVGLILRAQQGVLDRDEIEITLVDQMESHLPLGENEELISNIIHLSPVDPDKVYKFEEPMSVSIPHCCPRIAPGREPVVKLMTSDGHMSTLSTHDLIFDDIKELKFVEVRLKQFGTMAVFLRSKKEQLTLDRMGGKVISSVDSRVTISSCENTFKSHATVAMEVQPIDQTLVLNLKEKRPEECGHLMSTSPIVAIQMFTKYQRPPTLSLPCPANPALRLQRPQTAKARPSPPPPPTEKVDPINRPVSARMFQTKEEPETDELHLLRKDGRGLWIKVDDVQLTNTKKKDIVTFDLPNPVSKLALIRTKAGLSNARVEKLFSHVITALTYRPVHVIMRQKSNDPNSVTITCTQSLNIERIIKSLGEEGYDHGPKPSPEILLKDGQKLDLRFRGNLVLEDEDLCRTDVIFCNHIPFRINVTVMEHDKFAQKGFNSYRGFSQLFTKTENARKPSLVVRQQSIIAMDDRDRLMSQRSVEEQVDGDVLVWETLIVIPKPEPETPRPLNVTPVSLSSEGVVNDEMLRFLSTHLQNNDWRRIASLLNVRRSRLQAILRQNVVNSTAQVVYDILVTWSKRLPRAINRTDILCKTLATVGRDDLVGELRIRDEEYRQAKHWNCRESYLRKAFLAIARNPLAVNQWKHLARYLEVNEEEIQQIEATHGCCQESCLASLIRWKELKNQEATIPLLATKLRRCRYRRLAREIEDIR